eukprot:CAMPEP_0198145368 /NCGR_PEP_ID=MMETSP1443-20131203/23025_1 /TAXON_ID=186043 /ORGANISM="Entomoneis sp., Strain CCMP2396" /LENGTH=289 /DNA_ID=CAMNT_0043808997 /DNA_START=286 /DNA_END=1152 /DNA_ORIENTATION=+
MSSMEGNTSVTDIYIGPGFYGYMSAEAFDEFLQHIADKLTNLRVLSIGTLDFTKTPIHGDTIGLFLSKAPKLHTLRIERNVLIRTFEEAESLAQGFKLHPSLKRISLPNLHPTWPNCTLDPILSSLVTITNLESLQLGLSEESFGWHSQVFSAQSVGMLGTLPHLSWLVLTRFHIEDDHVEELCSEMVQTNAPIKILDITKTRRVTKRSWQAVLNLLHTQVNLEAVDMYCSREATQVKQSVYLFLKLNREGRRKKLRELPNKEEWVNTVSRFFINDLTAVNVLVRDSPW